MKQKTLKSSFRVSGVGVHSGSKSDMCIMPADENYGIVFHRTDVNADIVANYKNVSNTLLNTKISNKDGFSVSTIEHLCSALYAFGISNASIELNQEEVPILNGNASIYCQQIIEAGIVEQNADWPILRIKQVVQFKDGRKYVELHPDNDLSFAVDCDFSHNGLVTERESFSFAHQDYYTQIASARTFGFERDAQYLTQNNLGKGVSLDNTLVFSDNGKVINKNGMIHNEPVKHKILDAIGDLSLCGHWIYGKYEGYCPGHGMNNNLLKILFANEDAYDFI